MKMSTIKRKWDIAFILFVLVSAMLLGSGKSETTINPKGPVKMTYWANAPTNKAWMEEMARRFQKSNTELNFELEVTQFPGPQLAEKVIGTFIAKSGTPDFVAIQTPDIAKYLKGHFAQNNLVDLKSLINDPRFDDLLYTEQWMWENKYYGINFDMSLSIYYYRKDIFDEVGIDPSTWKTWEDYIRDGEKLKASKGSFMSVQDVGGWNQYFILMYLNGGGLFDKNGTNILNCKENIEALQLWIDFVNKYKIHWPTATFYGPGTTEAQREGKVAGIIIPEWYHAQYLLNQLPELSGKWRIAKLPTFAPGKPRTAHRGGTAIALTKASKYPEVAKKFLTFAFLNLENQREKYTMKEMGQFPSYRPSLKDPVLLNFEFPYFGNQKTAQLLAEIADNVPPYYAHPFLMEALDLVNRIVLPNVLNGSKTPEEALNEAKVELDKMIKQW